VLLVLVQRDRLSCCRRRGAPAWLSHWALARLHWQQRACGRHVQQRRQALARRQHLHLALQQPCGLSALAQVPHWLLRQPWRHVRALLPLALALPPLPLPLPQWQNGHGHGAVWGTQ
jgi:hypothetical protein